MESRLREALETYNNPHTSTIQLIHANLSLISLIKPILEHILGTIGIRIKKNGWKTNYYEGLRKTIVEMLNRLLSESAIQLKDKKKSEEPRRWKMYFDMFRGISEELSESELRCIEQGVEKVTDEINRGTDQSEKDSLTLEKGNHLLPLLDDTRGTGLITQNLGTTKLSLFKAAIPFLEKISSLHTLLEYVMRLTVSICISPSSTKKQAVPPFLTALNDFERKHSQNLSEPTIAVSTG